MFSRGRQSLAEQSPGLAMNLTSVSLAMKWHGFILCAAKLWSDSHTLTPPVCLCSAGITGGT